MNKYYTMKLLYSSCLFLMLFAISVNAQQLGIKGGFNYTGVSSSEDLDLSHRNGFHLGVGFETPILSPIHVGTGIFYTRRGYKSSSAGRDGSVSIDYIDIPIDLMLKFKVLNLVGAYVSAGPFFSYGLTSKVFDSNGILQNGYNRDEIDLNRIDSGINIGAGIDITNIRLSASYGRSFIDNGSLRDSELKNKIWRISVGYFFD